MFPHPQDLLAHFRVCSGRPPSDSCVLCVLRMREREREGKGLTNVSGCGVLSLAALDEELGKLSCLVLSLFLAASHLPAD